MHRALIIASRYPNESGYPNQESWTVNAELLAFTLGQLDYQLERLAPGDDLVRKLRAALRDADKTQSLLIYFTGYLVLTEQGEPALVLSDETATALRLSQLAERAGRNFGRVQFLVDAVRGTPSKTVLAAVGDRTFKSTEHALGALAGEIALPNNVGLLVGVRKWGEDDDEGLALSELMDAAIHELATLADPANSRDFADWIFEREELGSFALSAQHSEPEFVVVPRRRFPSNPSALGQPDAANAPPHTAVGRPRFDSIPPPLPGERELPYNATSTLLTDGTDFQPGSPPAIVPPPPPLPRIATGASLVLPLPVTIQPSGAPGSMPPTMPPAGSRTIEAPPPLPSVLPEAPNWVVPLPTLPPPPASPGVATLPPASQLPPLPPAPGEAAIMPPPPPPLPLAGMAMKVIANPQADMLAQLYSSPPHPSILPPLPVPGTPITLPAPEPAWPEGWLQAQSSPPQPQRDTDLPATHPSEGLAELAWNLVHAPTAATSYHGVSSMPPATVVDPPRVTPESPPVRAPQVISPESWLPAARESALAESLDEAALLDRAQHAVEAGDSETALAAARQCLALFPDSVQALQIAALELARFARWEELGALYEQLIGTLNDPASAAQLCGAAARVYREQLGNDAAARNVLTRGIELAPSNPNVLLELAELEDDRGDIPAASNFSRRALAANPLSTRACRAAQPRFEACGQVELARTVAIILSFLGQAGPAEAGLLQATQVSNLPQPARALGHSDFSLGLTPSDFDPGLTQLFSLLSQPLWELELPKPKAQQQLLSSLKAEDVALSTTTLTRAFGWTCRFLSINPPPVYLADGDGLPEPLPVNQIAWQVGRGLGRGLSLAELAFIWGRALGRARPESRILFVCQDTALHLQVLEAARLVAQLPGDYSAEVKQRAKVLRKRVDPSTWQLAQQTLSTRHPHELKPDLERFRSRAEMAANRVGLIACGDLEVAVRTLERFPCSRELTREQQASDLFSYACSDNYANLRHQLGLKL